MQLAEIRDSQGQVAIRSLFRPIDKRMARTVHWLERVPVMPSVGAAIDCRFAALGVSGYKHVLAEVVPMARLMPQFVLEDLRRNHLVVPVSPIEPPDVIDQLVVDDGSLRHEESASGAYRIEKKQPHVASDLAMIPLARKLDQPQMLFE